MPDPDRCNDPIAFGDDHGDNDCTFHCQLRAGHPGAHLEEGSMEGRKYWLTWERERPGA